MQFRVVSSFFLLFSLCAGQPVTFTGSAENDFHFNNLPEHMQRAYHEFNDGVSLPRTTWMTQENVRSGWDVNSVYMSYDYKTDRLYVGVDCFGICGDADGDGNPGAMSDPAQTTDSPDMKESETFSIMFWPEPPENYIPSGDRSTQLQSFYPTFVVGKRADLVDGIVEAFDSYVFGAPPACTGMTKPYTDSSCRSAHETYVATPSSAYVVRLPQFAGVLPTLDFKKPLQKVVLAHNPSIAKPAVEFYIPTFSSYFNFTFTPGLDDVRFAWALQTGSAQDTIGEELLLPKLFFGECGLKDACGVCGGDNSTCADCFGVPFGSAQYDICGVCGGDSSSCKDCKGVPHGTAQIDICGVCGGNGKSCLDCLGVPFGSAKLDVCGICNGNGDNCTDCFGVPGGTAKIDACGICGGLAEGFDEGTVYVTLTFEAEDTWIEQTHRTKNHGLDDRLKINSEDRARIVMQFWDVRRKILQEGLLYPTLINATLRIWIAGERQISCGWNDSVSLHLLEKKFDEREATWECALFDDNDCCDQWRQLGFPPQVQTSYRHEPSDVVPLATNQLGWLNFNVTEDIAKLLEDPFSDWNTYLLKKTCESGPGCASFWSCEGGRCPELVVTLHTNCPELPPPPPPPKAPCEEPIENWDL